MFRVGVADRHDRSFGACVGAAQRAVDVLEACEYTTLLALLGFCEIGDGVFECAPSGQALAKRSRFVRSKALEAVTFLERIGVVERGATDGRCRVYRLNPEAILALPSMSLERAAQARTEARAIHRPGGAKCPRGGQQVSAPRTGGSVRTADASALRTAGVRSADSRCPQHGQDASLDARARRPSSDPLLALSEAAAAELRNEVARARESGGGGGGGGSDDQAPPLDRSGVGHRQPGVRALVPWVRPDEATDADEPDRKFESLRNLFATAARCNPGPGHDQLFAEWIERGVPLELARQAIREGVQEKLNEAPGGRLSAQHVRVGFLRSILGRLLGQSGDRTGRSPHASRADEGGGPFTPVNDSPERQARAERLRVFYAQKLGAQGA